MKKSIAISVFIANFLSYAGEFDFQEIHDKINSAIPEIAFYDDACLLLDDYFFDKTACFAPLRRKEIFIHLFARNFGLRAWALHRKKLAQIAATLYQTILYQRQAKEQLAAHTLYQKAEGQLVIADFDSLGDLDDDQEVEIVIIDDEE